LPIRAGERIVKPVLRARRWLTVVLLVAACDQSKKNAEDEAAADAAKAEAVAETETVVDRASLAALCVRGALHVTMDGSIGTGVLIDKKDGTHRFGWVAGTLWPSAFDEMSAEQAARMLETQLKTAQAASAAFTVTCTEAIEGANPVVLTFTVEQKAEGESTPGGYWVIGGDTKKRNVEFLPKASLADARAKALQFALEASGATGLGKGSSRDHGQGSTELCPEDWAEAVE
jgi:hypothetical protein